MTSLKYYPQLDSLRAISVIGVMVQHFYDSTLHWGVFGVQLFFVLSGFLITSIILTHRSAMDEHRLSRSKVATNFYIRRTLRLFPIFYLTLLIVIGLSLATNQNISNILNDWPFHFLYLTNVVIFARDSWVGTISHFWSLAVEEQFYLAWFWIVLLARRNWLPAIALIVFLLGPLYRAAAFFSGLSEFANLLLPGCFDYLAAGSLLAIMFHPYCQDLLTGSRDLWVRQNTLLGIAAMIALAIAGWIDATMAVEGGVYRICKGPLTAFAFTWIIYRCYIGVTGPIGKFLNNSVLLYLGKISYGIYVYHAISPNIFRPIAATVNSAVARIPGIDQHLDEVRLISLACITILVATVSWYLIEKPINKLKRRFSEGIGSYA